MANRAHQELQSLLQMEQTAVSEASNSAAILESGVEEMASSGEASFAMPEALATAVGASWLLGPAGILLGVAQGILGKKEKQNAIDKYAAESGAISKANGIIFDKLDSMEMANPDNAEQIGVFRTRLEEAAGYLESGTPELMAEAARIQDAVGSAMNSMAVTDEAQMIAARAREQEYQRGLSKELYTRFTDLRKTYDTESQGFEDGRLAANKARDALRRGNPVDLVAATRLAIRTVEPTGPLTDEDVKAYAAIGNLQTRLESMAEKWVGTGAQLSDPMRRDFEAMINAFERQNSAIQMVRDIRFQGLADTAGISDPNRLGYFNRVNELPVNMGGEFIPSEGQDTLKDAVMTTAKSLEGFSDQAIADAVVRATGLDEYKPSSLEEMAESNNPRIRSAVQ